jgi:hypothetical protein
MIQVESALERVSWSLLREKAPEVKGGPEVCCRYFQQLTPRQRALLHSQIQAIGADGEPLACNDLGAVVRNHKTRLAALKME